MVWKVRRSKWRPQASDAVRAYDIDFARIVHSGSFRRLQGKKQALSLGDSDFYRTRLTHSLEVAQIAGGVVRSPTFGCDLRLHRQYDRRLPAEDL